ncbi:Hypothetical protein CM240_0405 [Clostridium bornimense]|uniref:Diguanylate cyclase/phosphodiesterase n=1 Tax=Clostridium bornimense TaxID=1216932 RepID=W6RZX7_9CLOT|nr:EAL domain-containing protein [Clostridium bornimense]CDM67572.1 Hypothetical protein CM240_0405 [Clostridium bornimense]
MKISKKINLQLTAIILASISFIIIINIALITYSSNKLSKFIGNTYYTQVISTIDNMTNILKATAEKISYDEKILKVLNENRDTSISSEEDIELIKNQINSFEEIINPLPFIKTINIVNLKGEYLFSHGTLYEQMDIKNRPWFFENEYLNNQKNSFITDIYKNLNAEQYIISVVKYIYYEDEPLGAVILDIFVQDLLEYIDSNFYLGKLNSYIYLGNSQYLSRDNIITLNSISSDKSLLYTAKILNDKIDIIFAFNKNLTLYKHQMKMVNKTTTIILIIVGIISSFIIVRILHLVFKPIINSLDKLKILLRNLEENNFDLEVDNEFEQLEFISESLGKSVDNKIHSLIYHDELTSLPNRKMLLNTGTSLIKNKKSFALLFIDLNNFKYVNDSFGHNAGDQLLINFSNSLKNIFKNKGIVTRYSGDEFVVIYDNYIDDKELLNFYNTIVLPEFLKPISFNNTNIVVEFSAGASIYPRDGETFDQLIQKSDFMMYSNKKNSDSNELLLFDNDTYNKIKRIEDIKFQLKNALDRDEFSINYQPIVNRLKKIEKVEALIRWNNGKLGFIPPIDFINCAEEIGEIVPIGYWIIEKVCKDFEDLYKDNISLQISINISPTQLIDINFVNNVEKIIDKYNIQFSNLCFEITESIILDENSTVYDNIHLLHKRGAQIALDDFGTGYASFNYLRKYKLDILKIDKIFIDMAEENSFSIIENIKNISHLLDMEVVIEGVETLEQFNKLTKINCDYFQGYYFSKPLTFNELKKLLF